MRNSAMLLLVSNAMHVYQKRDDEEDSLLAGLTERGEAALREKLNSVLRLCESSARMKAKVKEFFASSRNDYFKENFLFEDGRGEETTEIAAVSWFPPVVAGIDKKEVDFGPGLVPWTKASCSSSSSFSSSSSASSNDASVGERLRLTRSKRSMRAKKTAEDLFNEEVQTPTKKKKTGGGKRVGTSDGENEGLLMTSLQRGAATEAMKLVDQVKRKELSAMDIVCVVPIVVANDDDDDANGGALFDMNDPSKWPKGLVLAHGVVKRAKEKLGGEKVRLKIVPVYIIADEEDEEDDRRKTSIDSKASEKRTAREALINARLEHVSNIWGFTNTVVGSSHAEPVTVSDASVMWRGKLLLGGGLKTKLSSSAKNKNKSKNNSSKYKTHDRCIATVEVSRECLQCIMPFLPIEETSLDIVDNGEEVNEERNGETKAISKKTSVTKKATTTTTTTTAKNKKRNYISRKNEGGKDEDEEETVLKINDIVLMSAIDAIDIDSSEAPKHVSFSPYPIPSESDVNKFSSNWMSAYASFCAKKHDEGVPGECPVLLCSIATAMPMVVASDKNGSVGTKEKGGKAAALLKHTKKYFPVQSRDERVFVLAPVFSKTKKTTSVTFRLVKLVDPRSALERRVLFESGSGDGRMDYYSSQAAPLALPGSDNRRLSAEEERVEEALKTVARMVVARGRGGKGEDGPDDSKSNEASNEDETFAKISGVIDDYFAKRARCRGGKASEEDESMREYCIAWMRFLYLSKKDASAITITPSTNVLSSTRHHQLSTKSNGEKRNDEEAERNEWRRFYDALEKSSKETADDIRHDVSLVRVLHSAAMDCERKLENSETVSRLLRSRTPSTVHNNASLKRRAEGKDDGKRRKKTGEKKGAAATKKANKNTNTTTATLKTTTTATASKDASDKPVKLRVGGGGGGVVAGGLKRHATYANNPTTTNTTNSSAEEMRKRKLKAATMAHNTTTIASGMRYNRSNGPSNGSVLVAAATMSTDEASLEAWKYGMHRTAANAQGPTSFSGLGLNNNNNTNTASLSQQRPSESGAGSGAIGARGTIMCPNCNADLKVSGGMKFCCFCGGTLH